MADTYPNYAALAAQRQEGRDYTVRAVERDTRIGIIAPHGGGIEAGTTEIAEAVAGSEWSLYCFDGIQRIGNQVMHITSTRFDEPRCLTWLSRVETVLAIHGLEGSQAVIWVGGLHRGLTIQLQSSLAHAGFHAILDDTLDHGGSHPRNICNRGASQWGCQLEISEGLRRRCFASLTKAGREHRTLDFELLCQTIRSSLPVT